MGASVNPDAHWLSVPEMPRIPSPQLREGHHNFTKHAPLATTITAIAFYFPQYHRFPENDKFWGTGFTDWWNVAKATPQYTGHGQPRQPADLGFYDLRVKDTIEKQASIAANYGIDAFAYYFYWFNGRPVMDAPLKQMAALKHVKTKFCVAWANENWTRRWNGGVGKAGQPLLEQRYSLRDSAALFEQLVPYFRHPRYVTVGGAPVFLVYSMALIPNAAQTVAMWKKMATAAGLPGLYVVAVQSRPDVHGAINPTRINADAAVEFPPHDAVSNELNKQMRDALSPGFQGKVYSYDEQLNARYAGPERRPYLLFRTAMLGWDNTARMGNQAHLFHGFNLASFERWNTFNMLRTLRDRRLTPSTRFVFVNAWNEWAESTHLEPDKAYGFGYLEAFYRAKARFHDPTGVLDSLVLNQRDPRRHGQPKRHCMVVHAFSPNATAAVMDRVKATIPDVGNRFDVYMSTDTAAKAGALKAIYPAAIVDLHENRGRDILPFIETLKSVLPLRYASCLKVHGKETLYRNDGDALRQGLVNALLPSARGVDAVLNEFDRSTDLGMYLPKSFYTVFDDQNLAYDHANVHTTAYDLGVVGLANAFPAGSMYWFRPRALAKLATIESPKFADELGLSDGTTAHAVERIVLMVLAGQGYRWALM